VLVGWPSIQGAQFETPHPPSDNRKSVRFIRCMKPVRLAFVLKFWVRNSDFREHFKGQTMKRVANEIAAVGAEAILEDCLDHPHRPESGKSWCTTR
jgi:hypothetical protein